MASFEHVLPGDVAQDELLALIRHSIAMPPCTAFWCNCRWPKSLHTETVINAIDPQGRRWVASEQCRTLAADLAALSPCTPLGCIILTKSVQPLLRA